MERVHPSANCIWPDRGVVHLQSVGSTVRAISWGEESLQLCCFAAIRLQVNRDSHTVAKSCTTRILRARKRKRRAPKTQREASAVIPAAAQISQHCLALLTQRR